MSEHARQRRLNIKREYVQKRAKVDDEIQATIAKYEAKILELQKEKDKQFKKLENEEREALGLAGTQTMKMIICEALLNDISFEDLDGRKWRSKGEWSRGEYTAHIMTKSGDSWHGDTFESKTVRFTGKMIEEQLKKYNIEYEVIKRHDMLIVYVNAPMAALNDFNDEVVKPSMQFVPLE